LHLTLWRSQARLAGMSLNEMSQLTNQLHIKLPGAVGAEDRRVHFHSGDYGRPYVCDDPRCSSPSLDVGGLTHEDVKR
jgi:hypothetical protein